jgi:hypothetical protein
MVFHSTFLVTADDTFFGVANCIVAIDSHQEAALDQRIIIADRSAGKLGESIEFRDANAIGGRGGSVIVSSGPSAGNDLIVPFSRSTADKIPQIDGGIGGYLTVLFPERTLACPAKVPGRPSFAVIGMLHSHIVKLLPGSIPDNPTCVSRNLPLQSKCRAGLKNFLDFPIRGT